jgi:hypothetical protein
VAGVLVGDAVTVADRLRIYEVTAPLVGARKSWPIRVLADGDGPAGTGAEVSPPPPSLPSVPAPSFYGSIFNGERLTPLRPSQPFQEIDE